MWPSTPGPVARTRSQSANLEAGELKDLWSVLAGDDAARAYQAILKLSAAPETSVPFLRKHLKPAVALDAKHRFSKTPASPSFSRRDMGSKATLTTASLSGTDIWRGVEIHYNANGVPDGGWEMDRWGHVTAFGAAPPLTIAGLPNAPILQQLHAVGSGGFALAKWGQVTTYGSSVAPY